MEESISQPPDSKEFIKDDVNNCKYKIKIDKFNHIKTDHFCSSKDHIKLRCYVVNINHLE